MPSLLSILNALPPAYLYAFGALLLLYVLAVVTAKWAGSAEILAATYVRICIILSDPRLPRRKPR